MDKASSRLIEITVISGEELFINRRQRVRKNAFAVVKIDPLNTQRTSTDKDGGSYPAWNQKFVMNLPMHARHIMVEVYCGGGGGGGGRIIGAAHIPTADFLGGYVPEGYLHFLSYRLRDRNGERNGIVNLSLRVKTPVNNGAAASCSSGVALGDDSKFSTAGTVTGVPIGFKF